jgi:hypothetical protein
MWPEGQLWKPGPAYPATVAALPPAPFFRIRIFCSRGSLTPVAAPNASPNVFWHGTGCEEADSEPCPEGCGLRASCGNRDQRTRPAGSKLPSQTLIRHRRLAALKGHRIPAQGANPGTPPGKTDPRSEGTPHSRIISVSRTSTPAHPLRCPFRTHLFSGMRFLTPPISTFSAALCSLADHL